jgi:hypothetical protein
MYRSMMKMFFLGVLSCVVQVLPLVAMMQPVPMFFVAGQYVPSFIPIMQPVQTFIPAQPAFIPAQQVQGWSPFSCQCLDTVATVKSIRLHQLAPKPLNVAKTILQTLKEENNESEGWSPLKSSFQVDLSPISQTSSSSNQSSGASTPVEPQKKIEALVSLASRLGYIVWSPASTTPINGEKLKEVSAERYPERILLPRE